MKISILTVCAAVLALSASVFLFFAILAASGSNVSSSLCADAPGREVLFR